MQSEVEQEIISKIDTLTERFDKLERDLPSMIVKTMRQEYKSYVITTRKAIMWTMPIISWIIGMIALIRYIV